MRKLPISKFHKFFLRFLCILTSRTRKKRKIPPKKKYIIMRFTIITDKKSFVNTFFVFFSFFSFKRKFFTFRKIKKSRLENEENSWQNKRGFAPCKPPGYYINVSNIFRFFGCLTQKCRFKPVHSLNYVGFLSGKIYA